MTEEERLRKQVRVLEAEMYYKEKELLRVYRELDRFRRKCSLLKLRLRPKTQDCEAVVQAPIELPAESKPVPVPEPVSAPEIIPPKQPRTRRTPLNRMLKGEIPFNKAPLEPKQETKIEAKKEAKEPVESIPERPQKRKAAYMEPYAPVKFQAAYTPTHLQPAAITPLYESLQHKEGASVKWREGFQLLKVLYLSQDKFSAADVAVLREALRNQRPAAVASFLVQEFTEAADVFHFGDALELVSAVVDGLIGLDEGWDSGFLKALRALATEMTEQRDFQGCKRKMPVTVQGAESGNLLMLIVHLHTLICSKGQFPAKHRDLLVTLLSRGMRQAAALASSLWPGSGLYSFKVLTQILENKATALSQEVAIHVSSASRNDEEDLHKVLKALYRTNPAEDAYQLYSSHLWSVFAASFFDSSSRRIILRSLGVLIQTLDKAGKGTTVIPQLIQSLEEILSDTAHKSKLHTGFSESEQRAALHSLRKCGRPSQALAQWKSS